MTTKETIATQEPAEAEAVQTSPGGVSDASLEDLQETYDEAKAAYEADEAESEGYIASAVEYGLAVMNSPLLPPRTKYPLSLAVLKEVLVVDPENDQAAKASEMIVDIYGSMGREVPEGTVEDFPLNLPDSAPLQK